jgi:type II secretory pathway component GspD/PulD (secretin)
LSTGAVVDLLARQASAALPSPLLASTVQAATLAVSGQALVAAVSNDVVLLAEGVVKAMFMTKLKTLSAVCALLAVLGGGVGLLGHATQAGMPDGEKSGQVQPPKGQSDAVRATPEGRLNEQVEKKLLVKVNVNFRDVPLSEILEDFRNAQNLNIVVDRPALAEENLNLEQSITLRLQNVPLKNALKHILHDAGFGYTIQDGVLLIAPVPRNQGRMVRRVYPVADLVGKSNNADDLIRVIRNTVATPRSWAPRKGDPDGEVGNPEGGTLEYFPEGRALVISQTGEIQEQIEKLLDDLRQCKKEQEKKLPLSGESR